MTIAPAVELRDHLAPLHRLQALADPGTVAARPNRGGVVWATAIISGVPSVAFALDSRVGASAMSIEGCGAIVAAYDHALSHGTPIVGLWHSSGARLQEGIGVLDAVAKIFAVMTRASGRIPQISVVLGPAAGGAAYGPALTDIVIFCPDARVFVTGASIVRSVAGEDVDAETLSGPEIHGARSGVAHVVAGSEIAALDQAAALVGLLGAPGECDPGSVADRRFRDLVPEQARRAYDVRPLVDRLMDEPGAELHRDWSRNVTTVLGRIGGGTVGVVANNPIRKGGCLDSAAAEKAARFVRMCDALGIPLVVLVDVPGYLPGAQEEWDGVVRRGAKLIHAFAECVVPTVTVVLRKAYGGAYIAMNCRALGADRVLAWPDAEIAVMGAPAAVRLLHRRELSEADDPERLRPVLEQRYLKELGGVELAVERGLVDAVIQPDRTRTEVALALGQTAAKPRGRHGNIPL